MGKAQGGTAPEPDRPSGLGGRESKRRVTKENREREIERLEGGRKRRRDEAEDGLEQAWMAKKRAREGHLLALGTPVGVRQPAPGERTADEKAEAKARKKE